MTELRISIALCVCNGEKYIREQLASIANQTCPPDELIVRDDNSTDNTVNVIKNFSRAVNFPVRIYVNRRRLGSTKNFERAIEDCTGDIIFLSDQDDVWLHNKLALIKDFFNRNPEIDVTFSDATITDEELNPLGITQWESVRFFKMKQTQMESGDAIGVLLHHNIVQGAAMAFRGRFLSRIPPIPADVMHDAWIALAAAIAGSIKPFPEQLQLYRQHGSNQLGSGNSGIVSNAIKIMRTRRLHHINGVRKTLRLYEEIDKNIQSLWDDQLSERSKARIRGKISHMRCRLSIVARRPWWFVLWMREMILMRYCRYSLGIWTAGFDLIQGTLRP